MKSILLSILLLASVSTNAQMSDERTKAPKYKGEGNFCHVYAYYQVPLTPIYVLKPREWFKKKHISSAKLGWWYIPFITKRRY